MNIKNALGLIAHPQGTCLIVSLRPESGLFHLTSPRSVLSHQSWHNRVGFPAL